MLRPDAQRRGVKPLLRAMNTLSPLAHARSHATVSGLLHGVEVRLLQREAQTDGLAGEL